MKTFGFVSSFGSSPTNFATEVPGDRSPRAPWRERLKTIIRSADRFAAPLAAMSALHLERFGHRESCVL
jgi:hypothetical protein